MAAVLEVRLSHAIGLKDTEFLSKQDPYCVLQIGTATTRTRTHVDGGTRPVWDEVFNFNLMPTDQELVLTIKNANSVTSDELIGMAQVHLANVRQCGTQALQAPVYSGKSGKQHGYIDLVLVYHVQGFPQHTAPTMMQQTFPLAPMPAQYGAPPAGYGMAPPYQPAYTAPIPGQYGAPQQAYAPPQQAYGAVPQQPYGVLPPQQAYNQYPAVPAPAYGYAPMPAPHY